MLDRADCADFGCHNSIRLKMKHFLNTLALTFISFLGRFVFAMQKHYLFFYERSSSFYFYPTGLKGCRGIVFTHGVRMGGRAGGVGGGRREKVCPGCISETVRCRKLILGRDIG